ncbi:hypothetical protein BHM03_00029607 [Ensete ventricosum]|nr:hypothetical protein BHM03_00029607 [Ensete ventricosum]
MELMTWSHTKVSIFVIDELVAWRRYEESTKPGGVLVVQGFLPRSVVEYLLQEKTFVGGRASQRVSSVWVFNAVGTIGSFPHRGRACRVWFLPCCRAIFSDPQDLMEIARRTMTLCSSFSPYYGASFVGVMGHIACQRMAGLFGFLSAPTRPPVAVPGPMLRPPPPPPIEVINADSPPLGAPPTGPIPRPRKSSVAGFGPNN